jgi:ABC-2 type transport system ATP-binding protein
LSDPAIQLTGVRKAFGSTTAVEDLDLVVPRGSIYGLLGPNGAGKTTTIRMILDILGPDRGRVEVFGRRVDDEARTRIGYLPEERGLYQKMGVLDHVVFLGTLKGMDRSVARDEAERWLRRFDLGDWSDQEVGTLSKGMQQKVQFLSTILHGPELLILDEPFSGLDPINVDLLKQIVLERHREGATILFSTHMIEDAERLCDRVCMIAGARKVLDGKTSEVKAAFGGKEVALSFEGPDDFLREAPGVRKVVDHGRYLEVRLAEDADPQALLRRAVEAGVRVQHFELMDPPLREIFLEMARRKGMEEEAGERSQAQPGLTERPARAAVADGGER